MKEVIHGLNASIYIEDEGIRIKPGVVGNILGGGSFLSENLIAYSSISNIKLRKGLPVIIDGYIQINTFGGSKENDKKTDLGDAINRNIVRFGFMQNKDFSKLADFLQGKISKKA